MLFFHVGGSYCESSRFYNDKIYLWELIESFAKVLDSFEKYNAKSWG
ncbi:hypothetical protein D3Z63_09710 [Vibrio parahaemolyticus]|nr:hypothetical protein RK51_019325 [Vibrio parahaemolyticus]QGG35860.1 hypothetical protein GH799_22580 [Vibrio parahaemolyticus 10329]AYO06202.1 hypothetical protein D0871_17910 [Vibrio parahaemolyticus]EGQ8226861.1 hypothetical protein [Vibrio parahaemolyticus]EGQ8238325.1 hypothetical protein [Vibrio parahaemolyticus]